MWTPRRISFLFIYLILGIGMYLGYAVALGQIDGLPPLPEGLGPRDNETLPPIPPRPASRAIAKLQQAFGPDCPEAKREFRIELGSRNMVLACDHFDKEPDGRVSLRPISIAIFEKERADGKAPEINTVRGQVAYIEFDRPVANMAEIGSRKIMGGEIVGNVEVVNNRRTPSRDDDVVLYVPNGPVFYSIRQNRIWTDDSIHLSDHQSKPKPTDVRGKGLEIELVSEAKSGNGPAPVSSKARADSVSGVKRIRLASSVNMHLYVSDDSGFMASPGPQTASQKTSPAASSSKAHVAIKTQGSFEYLFGPVSDLATFLAPALDPESRTPADVTLTKHNESIGAVDQLVCEKLVLTLRKQGPIATQAEKKEGAVQAPVISTALATGKEVIITSDAEKLEAHGKELHFDNRTGKTILKGAPNMVAYVDGNKLECPVMELIQPPKTLTPDGKKLAPTIRALGKGYIDLKGSAIDKVEKSPNDPKDLQAKDLLHSKSKVRAQWNDRMVTARDGNFDLLTFEGRARFLDDETGQSLEANTLKIWLGDSQLVAQPRTAVLSPAAPSGAVENGSNAKPKGKPEIQRLEAIGGVMARSKELIIHDTGRLHITFQNQALPPLATPAGPNIAPINPEPFTLGGPKPAKPGVVPNGLNAVGAGKNVRPGEPKQGEKPIDLSARSIEAWVNRQDNHLDRVRTEGSVVVRQEPSKPGDKGVDIRGETLQLHWKPEGSILTVGGDSDQTNLAQIKMDRLFILGPEVTIDQIANRVEVNGPGAMQMDSATNLQGVSLSKTVPLEVHWSKKMLFSGKHAEFTGDIQAKQEEARLAGQSLQVTFDQAISLKEGTRRDQSPKVDQIVVDRQVRAEESQYLGEKLVRFQRIVALTLTMNRLEVEPTVSSSVPAMPTSLGGASLPGAGVTREPNEVRASGPGEVRLMQRGGTDPFEQKPRTAGLTASTSAKPVPAPTIEAPMKMTRITFLKSMYANNRSNTATFLEDVRVLHFPCENPNVDVEIENILERLPVGAIFMRCDKLEALSRGEGKNARQDMKAKGRVAVRAREFEARAEMVTYEDAKEQLIFHGVPNVPAVLLRQLRAGAPPEEVKGQKITYNRATGQFKIDEGSWLGGGN